MNCVHIVNTIQMSVSKTDINNKLTPPPHPLLWREIFQWCSASPSFLRHIVFVCLLCRLFCWGLRHFVDKNILQITVFWINTVLLLILFMWFQCTERISVTFLWSRKSIHPKINLGLVKRDACHMLCIQHSHLTSVSLTKALQMTSWVVYYKILYTLLSHLLIYNRNILAHLPTLLERSLQAPTFEKTVIHCNMFSFNVVPVLLPWLPPRDPSHNWKVSCWWNFHCLKCNCNWPHLNYPQQNW